MTEAILLAVLSVAAGTVLALLPGKRDKLLGPIRTFGLTASLGVVFLHLLPEALSAIGGWALAALVAGLIAPELLARLGVAVWQMGRGRSTRSELALEAGYVGLLVHHVGDGIGLGAYTGEMHAGDAHGGVVTALAAHAVPVVAIMVLAFDSARGRGSAIVRAVGLAVASVLGVLLTNAVPPDFMATSGAVVTAAVAGLLVHVVTHDLTSQPPSSRRERSFDLLIAAAGIAVSLIGHAEHEVGHDPDPRDAVATALLDIAVETGPMLLLGLVLAALLQTFVKRAPPALLHSRGIWRDAVRGAIVGGPLPLRSSSALPASKALKEGGATPAFLVAFLLSTPELGIETFALSAHFFGWTFAWTRVGGSLLLAVGAAVVVGLLTKRTTSDVVDGPASTSSAGLSSDAVGSRAFLGRFVEAFDELMHQLGAWMVVGVIASAFLQASLPSDAFSKLGEPWLELLVISLVAVPSYVCAPAATPLAAVLVAKGLSPGAALVGLLLGAATNVATLAFLRRWYGWRGTGAVVGSLALLSWTLAFGVNRLLPKPELTAVQTSGHTGGPFWWGLAALCGAVLLRSIWLSGTRAWLSSLQSGNDAHGHGHGHGHAH